MRTSTGCWRFHTLLLIAIGVSFHGSKAAGAWDWPFTAIVSDVTCAWRFI